MNHDFWSVLFFLLFAATVIQRIYELTLSRKNQGEMRERGYGRRDSVEQFSVMAAMHCGWFAAMAAEHWIFPSAVHAFTRFSALLLFVLAQALRIWTVRTLGVYWNVNIMSPDSAAAGATVVVSGPYRYIRHPNYCAVILEFASLPLIGGCAATAVLWSLWNAAVLSVRIPHEEKMLTEHTDYSASMGGRPRFIPDLFALRRMK